MWCGGSCAKPGGSGLTQFVPVVYDSCTRRRRPFRKTRGETRRTQAACHISMFSPISADSALIVSNCIRVPQSAPTGFGPASPPQLQRLLGESPPPRHRRKSVGMLAMRLALCWRRKHFQLTRTVGAQWAWKIIPCGRASARITLVRKRSIPERSPVPGWANLSSRTNPLPGSGTGNFFPRTEIPRSRAGDILPTVVPVILTTRV